VQSFNGKAPLFAFANDFTASSPILSNFEQLRRCFTTSVVQFCEVSLLRRSSLPDPCEMALDSSSEWSTRGEAVRFRLWSRNAAKAKLIVSRRVTPPIMKLVSVK